MLVEAREAIDRDVTLCGKYATGYKDGARVMASHLWRNDAKISRYEPPTRKRLDGLTVSCVTGWGSNYFHWTLELLTQLCCIDAQKIDHVLVPIWYPNFAYDSLNFLGLGQKIVKWNGLGALEVDLLSYGPQRVEGQGFGPGLERVRERFATEATGPRKIFVNREGARERRLLNVDDWRKAHPDFVFLTPKNMTILEQSAYFGRASVIAGPHGAGLTNMIWTKHCTVIDLFGAYHNGCFEKLAAQLGHAYEPVQCKPVGTDMRWAG